MTTEREAGTTGTDVGLADEITRAWPEVVRRLQESGGERAGGVKLWLGEKVCPLGVDDGALVLECPTPLFSLQIRKNYTGELTSILSELLETEVDDVVCRITRNSAEAHRRNLERRALPGEGDEPASSASRPAVTGTASWGFKMLRDFVVGNCNRIAYDAIMRILDEPASPINPLFIHGSSGLGKTHLEQGLALAFKERYPSSKIRYMTCEQFRNEYLAAVESRALASLRVRLRHSDLLLIDDIHFLSRGQAQKTKEELFATFNELTENGKKVVFTSDAHPSDIKYLEERFVQRFAGGLVVMLDRPDLTVRREVVAGKARQQGMVLPPDVIDFLADNITDNFRELEGAVNKILAYTSSFDRPVDIHLARQALGDVLDRDAGEPRIKVILRAVADYFDLTTEDIMGKGRTGNRSTARHIAMYLLKACSNDTYAAVAGLFGVKSHSTVTYACVQVARYRATDPDLDRFIEDLLLRLRRS